MTYDDIVLGAGSAGAVLAARLSEDRERRVLLIEAGPDYPVEGALPSDLRNVHSYSVKEHDWGLTADALEGRPNPYARGRVVGGTSAVNSAILLRGIPDDYDEWASLGCPEWAYRRVLPWLVAIENDHDFCRLPRLDRHADA